ncbi:MAG: hypothetical protein KDD67_06630 [Ignavibacteriae bacterium]|nr:hypothetical protein [Ignavibacteriota bacterium]MCB9215612.1 hypothetical protein [Ignavibacteria bacterium]
MTKKRGTQSASGDSPEDKPQRTPHPRQWQPEEDRLIRKWYSKKGSPYLETLLDRTRAAIQSRAEKLGVPGTIRPWTNKEEVFIKHNYGKRTAIEIARRLGRTEQSVRGKLHIMGLTGPASRTWTPDELKYLKKHYGKLRSQEIAEKLARSVDAVEIKAGRIGLARKNYVLNDKEKKWVVEHLGKISYLNMAKQFGVSSQVIQDIAHANGYRPKPDMRPWTEPDIEFIKKNYGKMPRKRIAEALGRTVNTVQDRACKLGLTKKRMEDRPWTKDEEKKLEALLGSKSRREIAKELLRPVSSVSSKIEMMGLGKTKKKR